jgi:hypothetical protein
VPKYQFNEKYDRYRRGREAIVAEQPIFLWQGDRQFDGRSQNVVVPHDPKWLLDQGVVVLDFTADRVKGAQGLLSKDAKGNLDGGHLTLWLDQGTVVARLQDKKSDYVARSPADVVKKGVPTRLALAFGSDGMNLYLNGKVVASNAHQGGLKGNQEPLVIGARDWQSSPRAADHLDAFFAGKITSLALYDHPLDGPAIAALGPAGTVLGQAAGPGTGAQPPAAPEVAVATPTRPSEVPVELNMPPVSVKPPVAVEVVVGPTITVESQPLENQSIAEQLLALRPDQAVPLHVGGTGVIHRILPEDAAALRDFFERAFKASPDVDERRAALFVELVKAALKQRKSDQELRATDWWARIMKEKRIAAAKGAQQAYADWQSGITASRPSRIDVMLGNDKVNTPSYEALLASGFERVSGPGTAAANQSWPKVLQRLQATQVELQTTAGSDVDAQAILDGVVTTLSLLKDGFTGWTTVAATAYSIASTRWTQVQEAEAMPGKLAGFLAFAKATTPSVTESLYTEEGAKQACVALIETML